MITNIKKKNDNQIQRLKSMIRSLGLQPHLLDTKNYSVENTIATITIDIRSKYSPAANVVIQNTMMELFHSCDLYFIDINIPPPEHAGKKRVGFYEYGGIDKNDPKPKTIVLTTDSTFNFRKYHKTRLNPERNFYYWILEGIDGKKMEIQASIRFRIKWLGAQTFGMDLICDIPSICIHNSTSVQVIDQKLYPALLSLIPPTNRFSNLASNLHQRGNSIMFSSAKFLPTIESLL